ncbi:hypothetical protein CUN67_25230 (plasmid) [Pantoea cypripedii]|uniref:Glycoside hydrolase family 5 domain-containing protein n=2 Tax=Pantoea cypripedii TaxID=55209 RepID=A0A6B9GGC2_PANCY|nr:hypothetical protein CUN67_25230 [Pantoea cypripedii]
MFIKRFLILIYFFLLLLPLSSGAFTLGVNIRVFNSNKEAIKENLDIIKSLNIKSVRVDMPWKIVEKTKGQLVIPDNWDYFVDYANSIGLNVLCILDYGNQFYDHGDKPRSKEAISGFVNYINFLTSHYREKIKYYQVWNEWNGKVGNTTPGTVDEYKNIVRSAYPVIKSNAPQSIVITGSFSSAAFNKAIGIENRGDYLRDYLTPDMANFTDAIAVHPYTTYRKYPFDQYSYYLRQIRYAYNLVKENPYFKSKQVFITEIGWSTSISPFSVSLLSQSKLLNESLCDARKAGYAGVFVYKFNDSKSFSNETEDGFGILYDNLRKKPAANMIGNLQCN